MVSLLWPLNDESSSIKLKPVTNIMINYNQTHKNKWFSSDKYIGKRRYNEKITRISYFFFSLIGGIMPPGCLKSGNMALRTYFKLNYITAVLFFAVHLYNKGLFINDVTITLLGGVGGGSSKRWHWVTWRGGQWKSDRVTLHMIGGRGVVISKMVQYLWR